MTIPIIRRVFSGSGRPLTGAGIGAGICPYGTFMAARIHRSLHDRVPVVRDLLGRPDAAASFLEFAGGLDDFERVQPRSGDREDVAGAVAAEIAGEEERGR